MKTYWKNRGIDPHIPNVATGWISVITFTIRPLYIQGKLSVSTGWEATWARNRSWHGGQEHLVK